MSLPLFIIIVSELYKSNPTGYGISIYGGKIHFSGELANKNYIRIENVYGFI